MYCVPYCTVVAVGWFRIVRGLTVLHDHMDCKFGFRDLEQTHHLTWLLFCSFLDASHCAICGLGGKTLPARSNDYFGAKDANAGHQLVGSNLCFIKLYPRHFWLYGWRIGSDFSSATWCSFHPSASSILSLDTNFRGAVRSVFMSFVVEGIPVRYKYCTVGDFHGVYQTRVLSR
jgi:hypothetical protein